MTKTIPASDFCISIFDGTHDTPKPLKSGYPLVTSKHINSGVLNVSDAYYVSPHDYEMINKRSKISQWDILFGMIGTVGEVYLQKEASINYAIKNIGVFSCKDEKKAKWLYYYLQSPPAKKHISRYLNGAVQKFLSLGALREFPVLPFNEASFNGISLIANIDEKIKLNNKINSELEMIAKTFYDYWFIQFDFPDSSGKPYKSSGGQMSYSQELKQMIPLGWKMSTLGKFINFDRGLTYGKEDLLDSPENAFAVLRATNINGNVVDIDNPVYVRKDIVESKQMLNKFETLIVMSSGSKEHVGKNGIYYFDEPISFGAFCSKISPKSECTYFVNTFIQSAWFKSHIKYQCLGTNINNLTNEHIKSCLLIDPPTDLIKMFEDQVSASYNMIAKNTIENKTLKAIKDWLLPMVVNGQISLN